jgi:hypothetical protein
MAEKKRKCEYILCSRDLYDDKYCIFHSKDIDRKRRGFDGIFRKAFERLLMDLKAGQVGIYQVYIAYISNIYFLYISIYFLKLKIKKNIFYLTKINL